MALGADAVGLRYDRGGDVQVQEERRQLARAGRRDPLLRQGAGGRGRLWRGRRPDVQGAVAVVHGRQCVLVRGLHRCDGLIEMVWGREDERRTIRECIDIANDVSGICIPGTAMTTAGYFTLASPGRHTLESGSPSSSHTPRSESRSHSSCTEDREMFRRGSFFSLGSILKSLHPLSKGDYCDS